MELVPGLGGTAERRKIGQGPRDVEVVLRPYGTSDFFRAEGVRYNYVTQRAMEWLVTRASEWVQGLPARVERMPMSDDDLLESLRQRARVAPRHVVGAFDKPKAFPAAPQDAVARVESQLGFSLPIPGGLRGSCRSAIGAARTGPASTAAPMTARS